MLNTKLSRNYSGFCMPPFLLCHGICVLHCKTAGENHPVSGNVMAPSQGRSPRESCISGGTSHDAQTLTKIDVILSLLTIPEIGG